MYLALHPLHLTCEKHLSAHPEVWNSLLKTAKLFIQVYLISISAQLLSCQQTDRVILIFGSIFAIRMPVQRKQDACNPFTELLNKKKKILTPQKAIKNKMENQKR